MIVYNSDIKSAVSEIEAMLVADPKIVTALTGKELPAKEGPCTRNHLCLLRWWHLNGSCGHLATHHALPHPSCYLPTARFSYTVQLS